MSKKIMPDLKELFKQAAEIAQHVPESMQEAAFNRAIDLLTGKTQTKTDSNPATSNRRKGKIKTQKSNPENGTSSSDLLLLVFPRFRGRVS